jgi:hypothetical protein
VVLLTVYVHDLILCDAQHLFNFLGHPVVSFSRQALFCTLFTLVVLMPWRFIAILIALLLQLLHRLVAALSRRDCLTIHFNAVVIAHDENDTASRTLLDLSEFIAVSTSELTPSIFSIMFRHHIQGELFAAL